MSETPHNGMSCADFQTVLTEAVEGFVGMDAGRMRDVREHVAACSNCGPLFAEALAGYEWARGLRAVEAPAGLVARILAATSGAELESQAAFHSKTHSKTWHSKSSESKTLGSEAAAGVILAGGRKQPHHRPGAGAANRWGAQWLPPFMAPLMHPRVAATFAMAFFSIALLLNLAGVHITNFRMADLKPSAVRAEVNRQYYQTTARVTKYYDSVRFVYELQSRVRELKNAALPQEEENRPRKREKNNRDISIQPGEQNNQHYSRQQADPTPALAEFHPIAMTVQPAPRGVMYRSRRKA
jgi:hypothetical protein